MRLYRKVIPKIAKDVVRSLLAAKSIEVEDGHRDEAELDVAGSVVAYLNSVDEVAEEARQKLIQHKLSDDMLGRVKRQIAQQRNVVLGDQAEEHVVGCIIESLFTSRHIEEVFADDNELRKMVHATMVKYFGVDEDIDREVRGRLKNLREGTSEWEIEYGRLIQQIRGAGEAR